MVRQFSQAIAEKQGLEWYREQMVHAVDLAAWSTKYIAQICNYSVLA